MPSHKPPQKVCWNIQISKGLWVAWFVDIKPCIKAMLPELGDLESLSYLLLESALASQPKCSRWMLTQLQSGDPQM